LPTELGSIQPSVSSIRSLTQSLCWLELGGRGLSGVFLLAATIASESDSNANLEFMAFLLPSCRGGDRYCRCLFKGGKITHIVYIIINS
jgi:hypothetical protein